MSNEKKYPMTVLGKLEKEREVEELIRIKRPEIVARIKEARELGDLSENAEYHAAKEEQSILEGKIATINNILRFIEIIDENITENEKQKLEEMIVEIEAKIATYEVEIENANSNNSKEEAALTTEKLKLEKWSIEKIQEVLNTVTVVSDDAVGGIVTIGKKVVFVEVGEDDEEEYTIVGSAEANPSEGKISNDSPIAKAVMGHKVGDKVKVQTPGGEMEIEIVNVK